MKRILAILMFAAVFGMVMGSVAAADMIEHDFDGKCKVQIPDKGQWMGDQVPFGDGIHGGGISIHYFTNDDLNGESLDDYINSQQLQDKQTDGNLTIYKSGSKYVVLVQGDDAYLLVTDSDLEEAKTIAKSADFGDDKSENATNESSDPASGNKELKSQNFFGFFKMDVPKDSDFGDTEDNDKKVVADTVYYTDAVNNITIQYINNEAYNDTVVKQTIDGLKQSGANVTIEGDIYAISGNGTNEVIFHKAPKTFTISSNNVDLDTLKDMASSIEITDK